MATFNTNNPWISPTGFMNTGSFLTIGGEDSAPVLQLAGNGRFPGMLGNIVAKDAKSALKISKTSTGTLFQGEYQLVKFSSAVTTVTRGQILCWDTLANNGLTQFQVTATPSAATPKAGIALAAETAGGGRFVWIQISGLASVLFGNTLGAAGSLAIQATAADTPLLTATTASTFLDGTATPAAGGTFQKSILGQTYETSLTNSAINRVILAPNNFYRNIG